MFFEKKDINATKSCQRLHNGEELKLLKDYNPTTFLFPEESEAWERVKEASTKINIYATFSAVESLFERIILTGNSEAFIKQMNYADEKYHVDEYLLVNNEVLPHTVEA